MNTLIIRFSPISNVAMLVPLLESMIRLQPQEKFVIISRTFLQPLFDNLPNTTFIGTDPRNKHEGIAGTFRLFKEIKKLDIQKVIDLQNNKKSILLKLLLKASNFSIEMHTIKHQWIKELLLFKNGYKRTKPLKSIFELYNQCFLKAGLLTDDKFTSLPNLNATIPEKITNLYGAKKGTWIGIAPFAQHYGKILPSKKIKEVIAYFDKQPNTKIFLFGAGEVEYEMLSDWETLFNQTFAVYTSLNLQEELELMHHLDVMVSMDSANMHLASLVNLPVVSIWGASHYCAGSLGWKQSVENIVENDLACRPCSILGRKRNKRCPFNYKCLDIAPSKIIDKIEAILQQSRNN